LPSASASFEHSSFVTFNRRNALFSTAELDDLMEHFGLSSRAEVYKLSLDLLRILATNQADGQQLCFFKDGRVVEIVVPRRFRLN
jgi:hypothetical protein